jgi:hypothetical protein
VTLNAFSLGEKFPPDVEIPNIDGMKNTAFVVLDGPTAKGVVPVDLGTFQFSGDFNGLDVEEEGIPGVANSRRIDILSPTRALFLAVDVLVLFNPITGDVLQSVPLDETVTLADPLGFSGANPCEGDATSVGPGDFSPHGAEDMEVFEDLIFVTLNNACFTGFPSVYGQGFALVFDLGTGPNFLTPHDPAYVILDEGYNSTALTKLSDSLIVTLSGVDGDFDGTAEQPSHLVELNPNTLASTRSLNLGLVGADFSPLAVTSDETHGYVGSFLFSQVYEIDLETFTATRGISDPIIVFDSSTDFISDQKLSGGEELLFVSSFNNSGVKAVDLTSPDLSVLPRILDFLIEPNAFGITGAGPMAVRPGQPTVDFIGPDLIVLTSDPGTVSTAQTY